MKNATFEGVRSAHIVTQIQIIQLRISPFPFPAASQQVIGNGPPLIYQTNLGTHVYKEHK